MDEACEGRLAQDSGPMILRVGAVVSVADVEGIAKKISKLRLSPRGPSQA